MQVGFYTEILFPQKKVHFLAINNSIDSNKASDNDFAPFLNIMNEWYAKDTSNKIRSVPFPVSWTVKMKKKQKETQDILSYHSQAAGCSDKARAKASGGRQPIEECGRTGL